jgi:membrane protease YdiL (CAAX protease family)
LRHPALLLMAFVLLEGPVRMLIATDPWLVEGSHWYFDQPLRLGLEILFVAGAGAVLWRAGLGGLMLHRVGRTHYLPLIFWCALITALFTIARAETWGPLIAPPVIGTTLLWFATGIFIGIGQELTFRGLLFTGLRTYLPRLWVWIISIGIFVIAPLHSYRLWVYWQDGRDERALFLAAVYLIAGVFFTWLRARTESLIVPGLIHALVNAFTFSATFSLIALGQSG